MSIKTSVQDWLVHRGVGAFYRCDLIPKDTFEGLGSDLTERVLTGPFSDRSQAIKAHFSTAAARFQQSPYIPEFRSTSVAYYVRKPKTQYYPDPMVCVDQVVRPPLMLVHSR